MLDVLGQKPRRQAFSRRGSILKQKKKTSDFHGTVSYDPVKGDSNPNGERAL